MKFLFVVDQLRGNHLHGIFLWWNQHVFIEWTTHRLLQSLDFNSCQATPKTETDEIAWSKTTQQKTCCFHHAPCWRLGRFFRGLQLKSVTMTSGYFSLLCCSALKKTNLEMESQYIWAIFVCLFSSTFCLDKFHSYIYLYIEQTQYIDIAGIFDGHIFFHLG